MRNLTRFIPGEEIGAVAQWSFSDVDTDNLKLEAVALAEAQVREAARDKERDEVVRQKAFAEGFAQGQASAVLRAAQQHQDYVDNQGREAAMRVGQMLESAREQMAQTQDLMARGVLELACVLARQVLRHELSVNPNALQPVIREGLQMLADDSKTAVVRLNPLDLEVLQDTVQAEFAGLELTLTSDSTVAPGGCLITAAGAVIDANLETRWRRAIGKLGLEVQWDE
jgi:flagellar assembly protein FliH